MKIINIGDVEIHLQGNQAFIYKDGSSDVLNIESIEISSNAKEIIRRELELLNNSSFSRAIAFEF